MGGAASAEAPGRHSATRLDMPQLRAKFFRASKGRRSASIEDLRALPELAGNPLVPRVFAVVDTNGDGSLTLDEFVSAVELFATVRSQDDVYRLAFRVFDTDEDGAIGAEELLSLLRSLLGAAFAPQQLERVVRATLSEYDTDGDGRLTLPEFRALVSAQDLASKFTFTL